MPLRATTFDHEGEAILTIGDGAVGEVFHHIRDGRFLAHQRVYVLNNFRSVDSRFLYYYFSSLFRLMAQDGSARTTVDSVRRWMLTDMPVAIPPLDEQRAIADYLDRETARIDALIEEQQRLIELLRERRQAVIDTAISEASAQNVHLRRLIEFLTSGSRGWGDYYAEEGERFLRIGNLPRTDLAIRGEVQYVDLPAGVTEGERTRLAAGDILFSITAYLGSVAVVDGDWVGGYVSQHVALCRVDTDRSLPRFIGWAMLSTSGQDQLRQGAEGGTKQQLALDDIRELKIPLPPLDEQRHIADYLDEQTVKIDTLIAETETFIDLARERRSALITAAVTGQIDVRGAA
jgi:type I restriction enzyme S subunit